MSVASSLDYSSTSPALYLALDPHGISNVSWLVPLVMNMSADLGSVPLSFHGSLDVSGSGGALDTSLDLSSPQSSFSAAASPRALAWWAVPIGGQVEWEVNGASALSVSGSGTYGTAGVSLVSALDYGYSSPTTISATLTPHGIGGWTDALSTSAAVVLTSPPPTPTCTDSIMLCSYLSDGDCDGAKSRL